MGRNLATPVLLVQAVSNTASMKKEHPTAEEIAHRTGIVTQCKWKNYYPPKDDVTMASDLSFEPQCQAIPVQMQENVKQM